MAEMLDFAARHWYLVAAFFFFLAWLLSVDFIQSRRGIVTIDNQKAVRLMNDEKLQIYDIRPAGEYQDGYIAGAKNLDGNNLEQHIEAIKKSDKSPLIVDARGTSATLIAGKLKKLGVSTDVYALSGGMLRWTDENLPITKK